METESMFLGNFKSYLNALRIAGILLLLLISCNRLMAQVLVLAQAGVMANGGSTAPNLTSPQSLFVKGNYAYVVGQGNALEIVDITLPAQPLHKGVISDGTGGAFLKSPSSVFVSGNYAYVTSGSAYALEVIDISNPAAPAHKGSIQYNSGSLSTTLPVVYVSGNYAYVGCDAGLFIVDVSNPAAPVKKGSIGTGQLYIKSISVFGNYVYTLNYSGVSKVNVTNPASPSVVSTNGGVSSTSLLYVDGNFGYAVNDGGLQIVDITKPGLPLVGSLNDGGGSSPYLKNPSCIFVSNNYAYITSTLSNTVQIVDVSVSSSPIALINLANGSGGAMLSKPSSVSAVGNYIYVGSAGSNALEIIKVNLTAPSGSSIVGFLKNGTGGALLSNPQSISLGGNYAYVASAGSNALEVVNITNNVSNTSNKSNPVNQINYKDVTNGALKSPQSVFVSGNYAYVASKASNALEIIDISNLAATTPPQTSLTDGGGTTPYLNIPNSVYVSGNYAYVASSGSNALEIVDVTNPAAPAHKGSITDNTGGALLNNPQSVFVSGNYAYVASFGSNALEIIDVTTPGTPLHMASLVNGVGGANMVNPLAVCVSGKYAYIACKTNLEIVDISNPAAPVHVGSVNVTSPSSVMVSGGYAYVASLGGTSVFNVNDPYNPSLIYQASKSCGQSSSVVVQGSHFYSTYSASTCSNFFVDTLRFSLSHIGSLVGSGGALIDDPQSVFISGNYAYVVNGGDNSSSGKGSLEILDITVPTSPVHKGSILDGTNGAVLTFPSSVFVSGNYAYVTCRVFGPSGTNALEIVDISNPANPTHKGKLLDGNGAAPYLNSPRSAYVVGNYAYVASAGSNVLEVIDVTSPAAPSHKVSLANGSGGAALSSPNSVFVSGNYVYVASSGSNALEIISVNPVTLALTHIKTVSLTTPEAVFVSGNYAYVASQGSMSVVDISSPATASVVGTLTSGTSGNAPYLNGGTSIYVSGNYAFITNNGFGSNALEIVDVSNPASPQHAGGLLDGGGFPPQLNYPWSVAVSGNYAFVAAAGSNALSIFYLYAPQINLPLPSGAVGSSLTIKGQNFDTFVTASIGGIPAPVTSVSATSITITVPPGATIGKLTLSSDKIAAVTSTTNLLVSPTASSATVAQNSFTANWSNVGAVSYRLDVATDNGFTSFVTGYNNRIIKNTSCNVASLSAGTAYYYRVRSYDSTSYSVYSSTISVAATPVSTSASAISQSGFTANWNAVSGTVTNYFLDVASDNLFQNLVPGYNNLSLSFSSTSQIVTGLNSGTYYYRVRSANSSSTSFSSSTITVNTIPANPVGSAASSIGATSFTANWQASTGATSYSLEVSNDNFSTYASLPPNLGGANYVFVSGNYAYVASEYNNALEIVDITNLASPIHKGSLLDGGSQAPYLKNAYGVDASGNYAYVASYNSNALEIIDVSNPALPVHTGSLLDGAGGASLNNPGSVDVVGSYAYVTSYNGDALEIVDVTNPSAPAHKGKLLNGGGSAPYLDGSLIVKVVGSYAYVVSLASGALEIINISNPAAPTHAASITKSTVAELSAARGLFVSGNYAYIVCNTTNALVIINISTPTAPVLAGKLLDGQGGAALKGPNGIFVSGNYAYIASETSNALEIVNISNPAAPIHAGLINSSSAPALGNAFNVFVSGTNAFVASRVQNSLEIVNVFTPSTPTPTGVISSLTSSNVGNVQTYGVTNLLPGTSYQYRVRANNTSGSSGNSSTISLITIPAAPVGLQASSITNSSFTANWSQSTGASSYLLEYATNNTFTAGYGSFSGISGSQVFYNITGLSAATQYYYRVTAINQSGSSPASTVKPVTTLANPATTQSSGLTFSSLTTSSITINFTAGNGTIHLVVASAGSPLITGLPVNQKSYTPNTSFNAGSPVGNGFVVSNSNATSVTVTNLAAATTYFFQVFDYNGSTGYENYNTTTASNNPASQATLASSSSISQPTNLIFFNRTYTSTSGSFTTAQGNPAGYIVLRSATSGLPSPPVNGTTYTAGNTIGSATVIYSGALTSFNDTGLSSATPYYYSIYSYNGSGSSISYLTSNPLQGSITTFTAAPTVPSSTLLFSNVSSTSITLDFTQGNGAGHLVVINAGGPLNSPPVNGSTYVASTQFSQGSPIGTGYVVSKGTSSTVTVNGLSPSTTYYFQVFDFNGSGGTEGYNISTANGNPLSQSTISPVPLDQPTNLSFSGKTASSVNVSFSAATTAPSGYLVLRSSVSATPSQAPVSGTAYAIGTTLGNSVIASVGPNVSFFDGGLSSGLIYYYTVYSYNGNGATSSYLTSNPLQGSVVLDTTPPVVSFPVANPSTVTDGNTPTFNATAIDNISVSDVQFYYRGITQSNFQSVAMSPGVNGNYTVQVQATWYDSLGLEYYVIATDENGNSSAKNASYYTRLIKPSISLPQLPSGSGVESYRIVSFPYLLSTGNDVTAVYPNVPWNDDTKAGLWWWNPILNGGAGAYDRYGKSATLKTVDPGKGYWAITSSPFTPQLSNVPSPNYSRDKLYQMNLKPGWNEIGNPYPVAISWDDVITYNQNIGSANFGKLNIYNGQAIKEATGTTMLKAFEGGFVKNLTSSDITIQIPFPGQTSGGRITSASAPDLSQEAWKVFMHISQDGLVNELGGFGMHPKASQGEDAYDNFNIPMFIAVPELHFSQKNVPGVLFSTDVVNTQSNYEWTFEPEGVSGKETRLTWNPEIILNSDKQLFLLDLENMNLINMSEINSYSFRMSAGSKFKVYFGKNAQDKISDEGLIISTPYPNPVTSDNKTMFKLLLPSGGGVCSVDVQVFTLQGESIYSATHHLLPGIQSLELDWSADLASGIYIYKVTASNSELRKTTTGKLVKP